jgi:enamine deaminase RidA (YjgF/YER057c/UK114 family)
VSYEARLEELGIELPEPPRPLGSYVPAVRTGNLVYLSGMLPLKDGKLARTGVVGRDLDAEEASVLARLAALNALSVLRDFLGGSLDSVLRCVKLSGFVASADGFTEQPRVINGASDLMAEVFGEAGRHARAAVGVNALPAGAPVEIEFIFEVEA